MADNEQEGGVLVIAGGTDWSRLGRSVGKGKKVDKQEEEERLETYPNLVTPHRVKALLDVRIKFIASGVNACHCLAVTTEGAVYSWGRNEKGQLGHGDTLQRNTPTLITALANKKIVAGACGKHHTLLVTADGEALACGSNQQGQLGLGSIKSAGKHEELHKTPVKSLVEKCTAVATCAETSFWLCDGRLWAAGNSQYGQLGDGSDHEYNAKDGSVKLMYEPQPAPKLVAALTAKVKSVACGQHHTVVVDEEGRCFTWGNGGYGRLGHKVQQDEFKPVEVDTFKGRFALKPDTLIAAGAMTSFAVGIGGQLFAWGKLKYSGDNTMYPKPYEELSGWNIRSMSCAGNTFAVAADSSVITWGQATNGELGYGAGGKKSSANPDKCNALENMHALQVACGLGFTMFLMKAGDAKLEQLPVFESSAPDAEEAAAEEEEAAPAGKGAKGKAKGKAAPAAAKGTKRAAPAAAKGKAKKAK